MGRSSPRFWEDLKKPDSAAVTILPDLQHCLFCASDPASTLRERFWWRMASGYKVLDLFEADIDLSCHPPFIAGGAGACAGRHTSTPLKHRSPKNSGSFGGSLFSTGETPVPPYATVIDAEPLSTVSARPELRA